MILFVVDGFCESQVSNCIDNEESEWNIDVFCVTLVGLCVAGVCDRAFVV